MAGRLCRGGMGQGTRGGAEDIVVQSCSQCKIPVIRAVRRQVHPEETRLTASAGHLALVRVDAETTGAAREIDIRDKRIRQSRRKAGKAGVCCVARKAEFGRAGVSEWNGQHSVTMCGFFVDQLLSRAP